MLHTKHQQAHLKLNYVRRNYVPFFFWTVAINVLSILWPANSVTNNTLVKLQICFVIDGITIKTMLESLVWKCLVCRNTYIKIFRLRVIKAFWMRRQLHLLIEQMEKIRKKEKDVGCEHWKQWNFMSLILQVVRSRLILYLVCLLIIIFCPLLFL